MEYLLRALEVAEEVADRNGDLDKFKSEYNLLRKYNGIMDSIRGALEEQGLWETFVARG